MIRTAVLSVLLFLLAVFGLAMISGCGYDGSYRYPCQDPSMFDDPSCNPPICEADGTCTKYLIPEEAIDE